MSDYISKSALLKYIEAKHNVNPFVSVLRLNDFKKDIETQPTVDEKEIIRKPMERILTRLEEYRNFEDHDSLDRQCIDRTIEIVKEEGGIDG